MEHDAIIGKAYKKALETLRARYASNGIHAGKHHFSDLWARDCCFAGLGSLSVGDIDIVKTSLGTLFDHIGATGQVPLRVGQKHFLLKYLFRINGPIQARYKEDKNVSYSVDNNPLSIILATSLFRQTKDIALAKQWFPIMKKIVNWQFSQDANNDFLIEEGFYAGWADSLKKNGRVLYTNVLHYKSLEDMSWLAGELGLKEEAFMYGDLSQSVKHAVMDTFWNGQFFRDWTDSSQHDYFSTDGNMLAIIYGLADANHASKIIEYVHEHELNSPEGVRTNWPIYPDKYVYPIFRLINMKDYHNGMIWLWLGGIYAIALSKMERLDEAKETLLNISKHILEFDDVFEVYEHGKPVNRLFYKSEDGFAWTSGIFVWACHELNLIPSGNLIY